MKEFARETLLDILQEMHGGMVIEDEITSTSRWSTNHRLIFLPEGDPAVYYETRYSEGATEQQDERPWQDEELVECFEVEPVEVVVTQYRRVK